MPTTTQARKISNPVKRLARNRASAPALSSALRMGRHVKAGIGIFYAIAVGFWAAAFWTMRPDPLAIAALVPAALHLGWQVLTLRAEDGTGALARFRANRFTGLLIFLACVVVGTSV